MGVLDGLRVVELSIAIAAPSCGRMLAFHGADVIKLESRSNPDVVRLFGSAWAIGMDPGLYMDTSPYLPEMCANKRSVGLDLKHPAARDAAMALIARADVFLTNYSTPAVRALGFGPDDLAAVNPRLIHVALPGFGSDAELPYYEFLAWGPNQAPLVGLDELTGYPDQPPAGIATIAPPDYFAGLHALRRRAHRPRAPGPDGGGHGDRHRPVRDDGLHARTVPDRPRPHRCRAEPFGQPPDLAGAPGLLPLRRR